MIRTILVPLDGSHFAEQALPLALGVARRANAEIQLLFVHGPMDVVHPDHHFVAENSLVTEWKTEHRAYLDDTAQRLRAAGIKSVNVFLLEGDVAATIQQHIAAHPVDLVVMTTHARGPVARVWLGSVADRLIRELAVPLLLVRPTEGKANFTEEVRLRHFLLPLDGTPLAEQIIEPAIALGELMDTEYTLLRVIQPVPTTDYLAERMRTGGTPGVLVAPSETTRAQLHTRAQAYLDQVAERFREKLLRVRTCVAEETQPAVAVLETADHLPADLIAMQTHGRRGLSRLLFGSVADKVLRGAKMPLLIQRPAPHH
ncbi:MAG: universal stress protein [Planctomycetia bacterium]|nr:universal stress protein [Planctomycetia bacterium]